MLVHFCQPVNIIGSLWQVVILDDWRKLKLFQSSNLKFFQLRDIAVFTIRWTYLDLSLTKDPFSEIIGYSNLKILS